MLEYAASGFQYGNHYGNIFARIHCNIESEKHFTGEECHMDSFQCMICGYVYNPARGDPSMDISPGTDFKNLPGEWRCPVCRATPDKFRNV